MKEETNKKFSNIAIKEFLNISNVYSYTSLKNLFIHKCQIIYSFIKISLDYS